MDLCLYTPKDYAPCTRPKGHDGPCAHARLWIKGLLAATGWDEATGGEQYYNVLFLREFGPFKMGVRYDCILINYEDQVVLSCSDDGQILEQCHYTLEPKCS